MAFKLDEQQQQAIETINSNILVSASAGAGKTGVLVQRLKKRILIDHIRVSRILAMTFTEAAASEMKNRLAKVLHEAYDSETDENQKEWINSQLIELVSADITTIDSYCLSLIKKYYSLIGLDPSTVAHILPQGSINLLKKKAFESAYKDLVNKDLDMAIKLSEYFSARSEDYSDLLKSINNINETAQSFIDPEKWYKKAKDSYKHIKSIDDLDSEVLDAFFNRLIVKVNMALNYIKEMKVYGDNDPKIDISIIETQEEVLKKCKESLLNHDYNSYSLNLDSAHLIITKPNGKNVEYTNARKQVDDYIKELLEENYDLSLMINDHNDLSKLCISLIDLAKDSYDRFVSYKQENAEMDFSDMERYAYNILTVNNGSIIPIIQSLYDEIMVDEFQDTSDLQNAIVNMISNGRNVFRVGDVKQSIYRFRQAKPDLMRNIMGDKDTTQIALKHNYRSKESIVEFSNHLFNKLMNIEGLKDSYRGDDNVSVGSKTQKEDIVPVEFAYIKLEKDDKSNSKDLKANWIAQKILSMKKDDPSLSYKSFCILLRSHTDKLYLRKAFDKCNIPYEIDAREGFYQSDLCQTVISFLRFFKDGDLISLLSILTSSFYGLSDDDLAKLKINHKNIYEGLKDTREDIINELNELKDITSSNGVLEFLKELAIRHGFYNNLDEASKANFDYLFETVTNSDIETYEAFLDVLEASENENSSEASSIGKDDDVVSVTTIHQSKGLQYGVVFLWSSMEHKFNELSDKVMINDDLKLGLKHISMPYREVRPTIQRMAVEYKNNLEDIEEYIRILYVAVTRAENRLFIVEASKDEIEKKPLDLTLLFDRKGMSSLILNAMEGDPYFKMAEIKMEDLKAPLIKREVVSKLPELSIKPELLKGIYTPSSTEFKSLPDLDESSVLSGSHYGTMIHEIFSKLPNTVWSKEDFKPYKELNDGDINRMMEFSKTDIYKKALSLDIHKEFPFYIEASDYRLTGTMDFVAIGEKEIILVDYKTDNASIEEIKKRYTPQLSTYMEALNVMYPNVPVKAYAYSLHHQKLIEII